MAIGISHTLMKSDPSSKLTKLGERLSNVPKGLPALFEINLLNKSIFTLFKTCRFDRLYQLALEDEE